MISGQFVVVHIGVQQLSVSSNTSHPMLQVCSKLLHKKKHAQFEQLVHLTPHTHAVPEKRSAIKQSSRHLNDTVKCKLRSA